MEEFENNNYQNDFQHEEEPPKRKKHIALKILVPVLLVAALGTGVFFLIKRINDTGLFGFQKKAEVKKETALESSAEEQQTEAAVQETEKPVQEASVKGGLIKNDTNVDSTKTGTGACVIDVSEIVENVMPSVVSVTDTLEYTSVQTFNPYDYFFGTQPSDPTTEEKPASGSGVIISENDTELLIVTNNHVVDNSGNYTTYTIESKGITVTFADGTTAPATIKGTDSDADLAVIAVQLNDISKETFDAIRIAVVGNSDDIKIGNGVIAIGNAMGYGQSVTTGIISAKEREVTIDGITRTLMQTDAAINPGNSGGGLFNAAGELIGINSAKSVSTSVEGMGFAIPITSAEEIIEELMTFEPIPEDEQGYLGITGETVPEAYVSEYDYPEGVSITQITKGSPAEEAGLQIYDIVTEVNGKAVKSMAELKKIVNNHAAGETVTLKVQRPEGSSFKEHEIDVVLKRYEDIFPDDENTPSEEDIKPEEKPEQKPDKEDETPDEEENPFGDLFDWFFNFGN